MTHTYDRKRQTSNGGGAAHGSNNAAPGFGLPNSAMEGMGLSDQLPPVIYREYAPQIPSAEAEADRLSAGIHGTDPKAVRQEMGQRLNADFNGIRFHSNESSAAQADRMGARAWASGRDVYFGRGGFDPVVAAHELVHTVQQGAVSGNVSEHAPAGVPQLWSWSWPWKKRPRMLIREEGEIREDDVMPAADKLDYLLKIQAGLSQKYEVKKGAKNAAYKAEFDAARDLGETVQQSHARAEERTRNFRAETGPELVKENEKADFNRRLSSLTFEDYNELMNRIEHEAVIMSDNYEKQNEELTEDQSAFENANSASGMKYQLYNKILLKLQNVVPAEKLSSWERRRAQRTKNDPEKSRKLSQAAFISSYGNDKVNNAYLRSENGVHGMEANDQNRAEYMKDLYKGKVRIRIDMLAEEYAKTLKKKPDTNNRPKSEIELDNSGENIIDTGKNEDTDFILTGLENKQNESTDAIKGQGMKENANIDQDLIIRNDDDIQHNPGQIDDLLAQQFNTGGQTMTNVKQANGKVGLVQKTSGAVNSITQLAMLQKNQVEGKTIFNHFVNPTVGELADVLGTGAGAVGLVTGAHDIKRSLKNLGAGGSRSDVVTSGLDTIAAGSTMVSSALNGMKKLSEVPKIGETLGNIGSAGGSKLIPGLNIATGAATAISGAIQGIHGQRAINQIDEQINQLDNQNRAGLSDNQKRLRQIFQHGRRVSEFNRFSGLLKTISGGLTAGTGIASLFGPLGPVASMILGISGLLTAGGKFLYDKLKKRSIRNDVTAEEMGIKWKEETAKVRAMFPNEKLSDKDIRAIILKGHGYKGETRKEAFKEIKEQRAKFLLDTAKGNGPDAKKAQKVIHALGIHRKNKRYTPGALKLLADKLG